MPISSVFSARQAGLFALVFLVAAIAGAQTPVITGFSPVKGKAGSTVTISGSNFNSTSSNNVVRIGQRKAVVTGGSSTSLTVTTAAGNSYGPVQVTTNGKTASSTLRFTPTFNGGDFSGSSMTAAIPAITTGGANRTPVIADFDNDGLPDLAILQSSASSVYVYRNTSTPGSVSFASPQSFAVTSGLVRAVAADMNGDGRLDLVISNESQPTNGIHVLGNTSSGSGSISFTSAVPIGVNPTNRTVRGFAVGDIDGDGYPDIAIGFNDSYFRVYRGNGGFGVNFAFEDRTTGYDCVPAIGDMNGDGKPDVVLTRQNSSDYISMYQNSGSPGSILLTRALGLTNGAQGENVLLADMDGDGKLDIIAQDGALGKTFFFRNTGTGTGFSFATPFELSSTNESRASIADMNGDGRPDFITPFTGTPYFQVYTNTGSSGSIGFSAASLVPSVTQTYDIATGDFDADGRPDAVAIQFSTDSVGVYRNIVKSFSASLSSVTLGSSSIASGSSTTVSIRIKDAAGVNQSTTGLNPLFSTSGGASTVSFGTTTDNGDGTYSVSATGLAAGTASHVVVTIDGATLSSSPSITVTPGPISVASCASSISRASIVSGTKDTFYVQTRDAYGNNLSTGGQTISFYLTGSGTSQGIIGATSYIGNGLYMAEFTGGAAGTPNGVQALINGSALAFPPQVTVESASPDPALSTISVSKTSVVAGNTIVFTLTARNSNGTLIPSGGATVVFSLSGGTSGGTIGGTGDNGNGTYSAVLNATIAGTASTVSATANGATITSVLPSITVTTAQYSTGSSTVSISPSTIQSGTGATVTFQARDLYGNARTDAGLTVTFQLVGNGTSSGTFGPTTAHANGSYTATFTGTTVGSANAIYGFVAGQGQTTGLGTTVTVTPGVISTSHSIVSISDPTVQSGISAIVTLRAKDVNDNNLTAGGATVVFFLSGGGTSNGTFGSVTDNHNGTYTGSFLGTTVGTPRTLTATINGITVTSALPTISVVTGSPHVTSISPGSGAAGTAVTINGTNFDGTMANNVVRFGGVRGAITAASTSSITVQSTAQAELSRLTVVNTVTGLSGQSSPRFLPVYHAGGFVNNQLLNTRQDFGSAAQPVTIASGDLDGDGAPDLVCGYNNNGNVSVFRNTGSSGTISFGTRADISAGSAPESIELGDFDGDGKLDIAVINSGIGQVSVFRNTTSTVGNITFGTRQIFATDKTGSAAGCLATGDLDGDGKPDLAISAFTQNAISTLINTSSVGSISFTAGGTITLDGIVLGMMIDDIDGDGLNDIGVGMPNLNKIYLYKNTTVGGVFSVGSRQEFVSGGQPSGITAADLNGDGKTDVIVGSNSGGVNVFINNGSSGTISLASAVGAGSVNGSRRPAVADVDGDGLPDIVVPNFSGVTVIKNTSSGGTASFGSGTTFSSNAAEIAVTPDLDGDGKPDIALANSTSSVLSAFRNIVPGYSLSQSLLTLSKSFVQSDSTTTITLTTKDAYGVNLASGGQTVVFSLSGSGTSQGTFSSVTDNGNGTYTGTFTGTTAGTIRTMSATINGVAITSSLPQIQVKAGVVSDSLSTTTVAQSTVASNTGTTVTFHARDKNNNVITSGGSTVTFFLKSNGTSTGMFSPVIDNGNGTYASTFTGVAMGSATEIGATVDGDTLRSAAPNVTVIAGTYSVSVSFVTVSKDTVMSDSTTMVDLHIRDANGNPTTILGSNFVLFGPQGSGTSDGFFSSIGWTGDTMYSAKFTGQTAGTPDTVLVTIGGVPVTTPSPSITVIPGAIDPQSCFLTATKTTIKSDSTSVITLHGKDKRGNLLNSGGATVVFGFFTSDGTGSYSPLSDNGDGTYSTTLTGILSGTVRPSATVNGTLAIGGSQMVLVKPGIPSLDSSYVTVNGNTVNAGGQLYFDVYVRDRNGNGGETGGNAIQFVLLNGTSNGTISQNYVYPSGHYKAYFDATTSGTTVSVGVYIDGVLDSAGAPTFTVGPNPTFSHSLSTFSMARGYIKVGDTTLATVRLVDQFGNGWSSPGHSILFRFLDGNSGDKTEGTFSTAVHQGNGVYTSIFTASGSGIPRTAYVTVDLLLVDQSDTIQAYGFPQISSISARTALPGETLTLFGSNFNTTASNNTVFIGNIPAAITGITSSSIEVTVPPGTQYGPVTLSDTSLKITTGSSTSFVGSFHGDGVITGTTFQSPATLSTAGDAFSVVTADLDGDGRPELIGSNQTSSSISVFPNTGHADSIGFGPRTDVAAGSGANWVGVGDIDGDGRLDLAVANQADATITLLKNGSSGAGSFSFPFKGNIGTAATPRTVTVMDMDGDGYQDMVVCQASAVTVFKGDGNFGFTTGATITGLGSFLFGATAGDLTGDGKPDIASIDFITGALNVMKNTGSAGVMSFASPNQIATVSGFSSYIKAIDLDGDGLLDLVATSLNGGSTSIYKNTASGNAVSFSGVGTIGTGNGSEPVAVGDLNGDGLPDLAVASFNTNSMVILPNTSSGGSISFGSSLTYSAGPGTDDATIADLDGDGKNDIITANRSGNTLGIYKNTIPSYSLSASTVAVSSSTVQSLHNDTITVRLKDAGSRNLSTGGETVVISTSGGTSTINLSGVTDHGDGTYTAVAQGLLTGTALTVNATVNGSSISSVSPTMTVVPGLISTANSVISLNKSSIAAGTQAIATLTAKDSSGNLLTSGGSTIGFSYSGSGSGTFAAITDSGNGRYASLFLGTAGGSGTIGAMIDGNAVTTSAPSISITKGKASISSLSPASGQYGSTLTVHGVNFNTDTALTVVSFGGTRALVKTISDSVITAAVPEGALFGKVQATDISSGLTAFSPLTFTPSFSGPDTLNPDSFAGRITFDVGVPLQCITLSDIDGDSKPDFICADNVRNWFFAFINTSTVGNPNKGNVTAQAGLNGPIRIVCADLDGDGKNDIVIGNKNGTYVSILRNVSTANNPNFEGMINASCSSRMSDVATGDLDGDGRPEIVSRNTSGSTVTIFKNNSTVGTLDFTTTTDLGSGPTDFGGVAVVDLDGDGLPEIIATNGSGGTVTVYRNLSTAGNFSFDGGTTVGAGGYASMMQTGDIDGDGKNDIVIANYVGSVSVIRNNSTLGTISLDPAVTLSNPRGTMMVDLGDVDGDGRPDIACANGNNTNNTSSIIRNISTPGTISFEPEVEYATDAYNLSSKTVALGDVDGDERPDLITANGSFQSRTFAVRRNVNSKFSVLYSTSSIADTLVYEGNSTTITIQSRDVFNNPRTRGGLAATFSLVGGTSAGTFGTPTDNGDGTYSATFTGTASGTVCTVYVALDGTTLTSVLPRVTVRPKVPTITSFSPPAAKAGTLITIDGINFDTSASNNTVRFGTVRGTVVSATPTHIVVAAPNGAACAPITVTTTADGKTAVSRLPFTLLFPGKTISASSFASGLPLATGAGGFDVAAGDFNDDGKTDIGVSDPFGGALLRLFRNATTTPSTPLLSADSAFAMGSFSWGMATADFDGDGKLDVAASNLGGASVSVLRNRTTGSLLSFDPEFIAPVSAASSYLAAADLDGDGRPDIVAATSSGMDLLMNTGRPDSIGFGSAIAIAISGTPNGVVLADLDADGDLDLVFANSSSGELSWRPNTTSAGVVSFGSQSNLAAGASPTQLGAADFDGDGKLDIAVTASSSNSVSVFRNTSSGGSISFASAVSLATGNSPAGISIGDFNGDGLADIATANSNNGTVSVIMNTSASGSLTFLNAINLAGAGNPLGLRVADLTTDGMPDILVSNTIGSATLYRNQLALSNAGFSASPSAVAAGTVGLGGTGQTPVTVKNTGTDTLVVTASIAGDTVFTTAFGTMSIKPGDSTLCTVNFTPLAAAAYSAKLIFTHNAPSSPDTLSVIGTGAQLTVAATAGPHGSISPSGTVNVSGGANQQFTVTPDSLYKIDSVIVDGVYQGTGSTWTFNSLSASHTIRAVFVLNGSMITAVSGGHGTISPSGQAYVAPGDSAVFTFTADQGYHIGLTSIDGVDTSGLASYTFRNVTAAHSITAHFVQNSYVNNIASGKWSESTTWSFNRMPEAGDSVVIMAGTTVKLDTDGVAGALTVAGELQYDSTVGRFVDIVNSGGRSGNAAVGGTVRFNSIANQRFVLEGDFACTGSLINSSDGLEGSAIVFDGTGNRSIASSAAIRVLEVKNGIRLSPGSALTVSSELIMINGKLALGPSDMMLGQTGDIIGASSVNYIVTDSSGTLMRNVGTAGVSYPVGTDSSYSPVQLWTSTGSDTFSVRVIGRVSPSSPNDAAGIKRTYDVNKRNGSVDNGPLSMTVQWSTADEGAAFVRNTAVSWYWDGSAWVEEGMVGGIVDSITGQASATITGLTESGRYTVANPGALPIQLAAFTGTMQPSSAGHANVELSWNTVSEEHLLGFTVQRKPKGSRTFTNVSGLISAEGSPTEGHRYAWKDESPSRDSVNVYRLRVVDLSNSVAYSPEIEVSAALGTAADAEPLVFKLQQNYPNPFNPSTTVSYSIPTAGEVTLRVYNMLGQQVAELVNTFQPAGRYSVEWNAASLASGAYIYRLQSNGNAQVRKMLFLK